jgi:hypothetical protein
MSKKYLQILLSTVCVLHLGLASLWATPSVGKYQTISIPLPHSQLGVKNVWNDIVIISEFTAPSGHLFNRAVGDTIGGFYHSNDLWMTRFAPDEVGTWHYKITLTDRGKSTIYQDSFFCAASNEQGFIRLNDDFKRWYYSGTGKLYSGVGFGDCMSAARDSILQFGPMDGGYRPHGYHEGIDWNMPYSQYLIAYGDAAGFNLYRYSDGNCAYTMVKQINGTINDYDTLHCRWTDTLFFALRQHGFRIFMTLLPNVIGSSNNQPELAAVDHYAQFCIDRFGPLVDFWELTNESSPDSLWTSHVARYIQLHDPYGHPVSVSWQQPSHPAIQVISPHWYGREDVRNSDQATADQIDQYKAIQKPVIFGEQGEGGVWDSLSPIRLRGRIWSALFNTGTIIFWNSSFAKDCSCNQYLGWPERRAVRVMQNFAPLLDPYVSTHSRSKIGNCTAWAMNGQNLSSALYIRNDQDVFAINKGLQVPVNVLSDGKLIWYDVHTGDILVNQPIKKGQTTLTAPDFQTDIAMIVGNFSDQVPSDKLFRLDVNPRTFQLLGVPVNAERTFTVTLTNIGSDTITITRAFTSSASPKLMLSIPVWIKAPRLAPNEKMDVQIGYTMIDTGGTGAMLSFEHSGSPAWENVALSATAIPSSSVSATASESEWSVAPDPANTFIMLRNNRAQAKPMHYEIFSATGQRMLEGTTTAARQIDIHTLENGAFQMRLTPTVGNPTVLKFAVQR